MKRPETRRSRNLIQSQAVMREAFKAGYSSGRCLEASDFDVWFERELKRARRKARGS